MYNARLALGVQAVSPTAGRCVEKSCFGNRPLALGVQCTTHGLHLVCSTWCAGGFANRRCVRKTRRRAARVETRATQHTTRNVQESQAKATPVAVRAARTASHERHVRWNVREKHVGTCLLPRLTHSGGVSESDVVVASQHGRRPGRPPRQSCTACHALLVTVGRGRLNAEHLDP